MTYFGPLSYFVRLPYKSSSTSSLGSRLAYLLPSSSTLLAPSTWRSTIQYDCSAHSQPLLGATSAAPTLQLRVPEEVILFTTIIARTTATTRHVSPTCGRFFIEKFYKNTPQKSDKPKQKLHFLSVDKKLVLFQKSCKNLPKF